MKLCFWSHGESFLPRWRKQEIEWIQSYAQALEKLDYKVSFMGPLLGKPIDGDILHIFGSGHWETLFWLSQQAPKIIFSPYPFSIPFYDVNWPESSSTRKIKWLWRALWKNQLNPEVFNAIQIPSAFLLPSYAAQAGSLKIRPRNKQFIVSNNPEKAALQFRDLMLRQG